MTFEVRGGYFSYDGITDNLCDINFSLESPEILCVLGPNGVGKTTLIKSALGLMKWRSGATYLNGTDISKMHQKDFWRCVGYVPQAKLSSFVYSVREMVLLGRSSHIGDFSTPGAKDIEAAEKAMELTGVAHLADKLCSRISGGELQMVLIARAMASNPALLVLDEPESNLDFKNQRHVLSEISTLCKERGIAALINTHYPEHALDISQKALLLFKDKSAISGATCDVLTEENLKNAFDMPVHIHRFYVEPFGNRREYVTLLPLDSENDKIKLQTERLKPMETRIAQIGIIVEDKSAVDEINKLLHEYGEYIIGRMGMPYKERGISIISVIIDAPNEVISALSGKLGMTQGVSAKTVYSKV